MNSVGTNNITLYCSNGTPSQPWDPTTIIGAGPAAVPVLTNNVASSTSSVLVGFRTTNNSTGVNMPAGTSFTLLFSSANGGFTSEPNSVVPSFATQGDDFYGMSALNEYGATGSSSVAHFVWIDSTGSLRYAIRTSSQTWAPTSSCQRAY